MPLSAFGLPVSTCTSGSSLTGRGGWRSRFLGDTAGGSSCALACAVLSFSRSVSICVRSDCQSNSNIGFAGGADSATGISSRTNSSAMGCCGQLAAAGSIGFSSGTISGGADCTGDEETVSRALGVGSRYAESFCGVDSIRLTGSAKTVAGAASTAALLSAALSDVGGAAGVVCCGEPSRCS